MRQELLAVDGIHMLRKARYSVLHLDDVERVVSQLGSHLRFEVPNSSGRRTILPNRVNRRLLQLLVEAAKQRNYYCLGFLSHLTCLFL